MSETNAQPWITEERTRATIERLKLDWGNCYDKLTAACSRGDEESLADAVSILDAVPMLFGELDADRKESERAHERSTYSHLMRFLQRWEARCEQAFRAMDERKKAASAAVQSIRQTVSVLGTIEEQRMLSVELVGRVADLDRAWAAWAEAMGIANPLTPPDYAAALAAWIQGTSSDLAGRRRAEVEQVSSTIESDIARSERSVK